VFDGASGIPHGLGKIVELMKRLFQLDLGIPAQNSRGAIKLTIAGRREGAACSLLFRRGFQQMLLIFALSFSHKRSVLLVDEPDCPPRDPAPETGVVLLRDIATQNESQVVMVTHSEVILEAALETT